MLSVVVMSTAVVIIAVVAMVLVVAAVIIAVMPVILVLVPGPVTRLVLGGAYEVNRTVAGMILVAMVMPVARVPWRDVQVDRLNGSGDGDGRRWLRDHRLRVHDGRWRTAADHHLAIYARNDLAADRRIYADALRVRE
jgi:hypothetical protein